MKRYVYILDFRQFQNCLPIFVSCSPNRTIQFKYVKYPGNECTFNDIYDMADCTGESKEKLKKYIDKDKDLYNRYTLRTVPFEEQFRRYDPVIIDDEEYFDVSEASEDVCIPERCYN